MWNDVNVLVEPANAMYACVQAFVDELYRSGLRHVVICPGSRSTPLAMAFAIDGRIRIWMHIDERSAAFFGLGMAKRLGKPVALLCTSGTAAANFYPAIVEAHLTHVPLVVLTADRPHELRDVGAPQAIDQNRLYGVYAKWFVEVALPEATNGALRYVRALAGRAVAQAQSIPAGPVHLNFPFREPLTPEPLTDQPLPDLASRDSTAWYGRANGAPYIEVSNAPLAVPAPERMQQLAESLRAKTRGLILAGPQRNAALAEPLVRLARTLGYPILADPLSQVRTCERDPVLTSYDAFLRSEHFVERAQPEVILRFGAMPTSKPVLLYLKRYADCPQMVIDGNMGWEEPTQLASMMVHADPAAFCENLLSLLKSREIRNAWMAAWQTAENITREVLQGAIEQFEPLFEGRVFPELAAALPEHATLYVGNSMPVRDLDTFFWRRGGHLRILGNRGANGIDGLTSCALGASAVSEGEPTVLVVGDLSFLHDLNGLLAAQLHNLNLTVVLINNDGGGIFSFLPQANYPAHFEQLFGTPSGLDFRAAAQLYGGTFWRIERWEQFREALSQSFTGGGLHIIEVPTERESNVRMHRQLWQLVDAALAGRVS